MSSLKEQITRPVLITGATGMLGSDLALTFRRLLGPELVVATDSKSLDITSAPAVAAKFKEIKPQVVINAAAYTNVDKAEEEREKAYLLNVEGPKNLRVQAEKHQSRLVHFSSEYVFSGMGNRPWTEDDVPNPPSPNYYAETKLMGEKEVLSYPGTLLLRVQWLYGVKRDRFTGISGKKIFTPFIDQFGAPTWTRDVCKAVVKLLEKNAAGIFHFSYDDFSSWADVYEFVKRELGASTELVGKRSEEAALPAKRPLFGVMSNRKLAEFLGQPGLGSWKEPLREFLHEVQKAK